MWHSLTTLISVLSGTERRSLVLLLVVLMLVEAMLEMTGVAVVPLYITLLAYPDKLIDNPLLRDALSREWREWLSREHLLYGVASRCLSCTVSRPPTWSSSPTGRRALPRPRAQTRHPFVLRLSVGMPFPVVLTAVTVILAPLPFGGTALVWGPVVIYFLMVGPLWKALAMLGWGIGVVSMIDQFLRPWLIGQAAQIPVLFLVFSVLGGLALYGLIGLFVGPVLVSLLITAIQIYREEYHNAQTGTPAGPATPS